MPKVVPQYTDDAKRRIVQAAMEAMAERGYDNVTVDDVARKIGVTKGAVYWYFRSKSVLLQEVLETIEGELYNIASDPYFTRPDTSGLTQKFDRMLFLEENRRDILYGVGLLESPADRIQAVTADSIRGLVSALEKGIEREQKHGTFSSLANPKTLALTLAVLCSGIQKGEIYAILFLSQSNLRRIWFHSIKLFLNPAISP
jgi:AcrR family transcriptional regulator